MINKFIVSGYLPDKPLFLNKIKNSTLEYASVTVITQNQKKDGTRVASLRAYGKIAKYIVENQGMYKHSISIYTGEINYLAKEKRLYLHITEIPKVIADLYA